MAHPAFYDTDGACEKLFGTAIGNYILVSAGADGVYLSHQDGPVNDDGGYVQEWEEAHPDQLEDFDDVIRTGGG